MIRVGKCAHFLTVYEDTDLFIYQVVAHPE